MLGVPMLGMVYDLHKDIAPVDLTGQVRLPGLELCSTLTGALKGHYHLSTQGLHKIQEDLPPGISVKHVV